MRFWNLKFLKISEVKEHEEIDLVHFKNLKQKIESDGIFKKSIVVDKNTKVVLNGEHRLNVLNELGCSKIPAILVNYFSPKIKVLAWRKAKKLAKRMLSLLGYQKKIATKNSKHMIEVDGKMKHISFIQKRVDIHLEELR